mgnify:CR=1 FL=1
MSIDPRADSHISFLLRYRLIEEAYGSDQSVVNYKQINHLVALAQVGITCPIRFRESEPNMAMDCHSMFTNLIPFPNLKNVTPAVLPLRGASSKLLQRTTHTRLMLDMQNVRLFWGKINASVYELTAEAFLNNHEMCSLIAQEQESKYFSCCLFYRGDCSVDQVSNACFHVNFPLQHFPSCHFHFHSFS